LKILALHQPVAIDLRRIATVLKITGELERVADLAVHIAERACEMGAGQQATMLDSLREMALVALEMLHGSIDAYVNLDSQLARNICERDDVVDQLNREIITELIAAMQRSTELVYPLLQLFSISRHVERIADHATNIAEDVVYLVEGQIIRHKSAFERA
jgi:phosphate transport system protein